MGLELAARINSFLAALVLLTAFAMLAQRRMNGLIHLFADGDLSREPLNLIRSQVFQRGARGLGSERDEEQRCSLQSG